MYIARATLFSKEFGKEAIKIVTKKEEEIIKDSSIVNLYYESGLANAIMKASAYKYKEISFNTTKYQLIDYICNRHESEFNPYIDFVVYFTNYKKQKPIFLYRNFCRCISCFNEYGYDSIENRNAIVPILDNPKMQVKIDVQYCKRCCKYFMDLESLNIYEKKFGVLMFERRIDNIHSEFEDRGWDFEPNSVLSRFGYSAGSHAPPQHIREKIISMLIDNGISSKSEIKQILSTFISTRGYRCQNAVKIWRKDLEYVNNYKKETQDTYINFYFNGK